MAGVRRGEAHTSRWRRGSRFKEPGAFAVLDVACLFAAGVSSLFVATLKSRSWSRARPSFLYSHGFRIKG